jgi:glycosyltransferase involved in cell wall biosynthesis
MSQSVGLLLIAKNEAHVIGRALDSGRQLGIESMTVVVDESTTDETVAVATAHGAHVHVRPYLGSIAAARNEAIDLVRGASAYTLMLDPDDVYEGHLPETLRADVYDVWVHDEGYRFPRLQLFKTDCGVTYRGIRHEEAIAPDSATRSIAQGLIYKRIGGGWQDSLGRRAKFLSHASDLEAWMLDHPDDGRALLMLAQSYRDAGECELARVNYEKRIAAGGSPQERYIAALEVAFLVEKDATPELDAVMRAYLRAHEAAPLHAEPLFHLASFLREKGAAATAWHLARRAAELSIPRGRVTIYDIEVYEWKALAEMALTSWTLGDRGTAAQILRRIAGSQPLYAEWAEDQLAVVMSQDSEPPISPWGPSSRLNVTRGEDA